MINNRIITGLPRSGTTLICYLLNKLPNVVALHEPMDIAVFRAASDQQIIETIDVFFSSQRCEIFSSRKARSKSIGGKIPDNQLSDVSISGVRQSVINSFSIDIDNVSDKHFNLYVKHPSIFTAMLPLLDTHFHCYANIRNPLAVLLSWSNTDYPVSRGRAPAAEMMDIELRKTLDSFSNTIDRQLALLDYFFSQYATADNLTIVRYEDVVGSSGRALASLEKKAEELNVDFISRNKKEITSNPFALSIAERLLASDSACWSFYSRDDVTALFS